MDIEATKLGDLEFKVERIYVKDKLFWLNRSSSSTEPQWIIIFHLPSMTCL